MNRSAKSVVNGVRVQYSYCESFGEYGDCESFVDCDGRTVMLGDMKKETFGEEIYSWVSIQAQKIQDEVVESRR